MCSAQGELEPQKDKIAGVKFPKDSAPKSLFRFEHSETAISG